MNKMMLYKILRPLVYVLFKIVYKPEVINKEYIPKEQPKVFELSKT